MKKLSIVIAFFALIGVLLSACAPLNAGAAGTTPTASPQPQPQMGIYEAQVHSVKIQVLDGSPQQVTAVISGVFGESCSRLGESKVEYADQTFKVTVYAVTPVDHGCAPVVTPFETTVALDAQGKPAGTYTVSANGTSAVFVLKVAGAAPTLVPTAVPTVASGAQGCTDSAAFVTDLTIPDNTLFSAGTPFTKTWRLKNTGTCTWDSSYMVYYSHGDAFTQAAGYQIVPAGQRVAPGQTVDVSVGMTAPLQTGYFTSYWVLKAPGARLVPLSGGATGSSFFVKIRVADVIFGSGKIIDQSIDIVLEQGSGEACMPGATYLVHARLTADGPISALYEVDSTAGQISAGYFVDPNTGALLTTVEGTATLDASLFAADGTQALTIPLRFVGPYPYPKDIQVNFWVDGGQWVSAKVPCP